MNARRYVRAVGACGALLMSASMPTLARAQLAGEVSPPERASVDENGVNVATGQYRSPRSDLVVGSGPGALSDVRIYGRQVFQDARIILHTSSDPFGSPAQIVVGTGDKTYSFSRSGSGFVTASDGARLTTSGGVFQLTLQDGTRYTYGQIEKASRHAEGRETDYDAFAYLSQIEYSSGLKLTLNWLTSSYCAYGSRTLGEDGVVCQLSSSSSSGPPPQIWLTRLTSFSSNAGFLINYQYAGSSLGVARRAPTAAEIAAWKQLTNATGGNSQGGLGSLPSVNYSYAQTPISSGGYISTDDVTDALGRTSRYTKQVSGSDNYEAVRRPGATADNLRVNTDAQLHVTSIIKDGATWNYTFATPTATTSALTVTDPTGRVRKYTSDLLVGLPTRIEDEYGRVTSYIYDSSGRLKTATAPGDQITTYDYDDRSNVTRTTVTAVGGATISSTATYQDYSCTTLGTCNRAATSTSAGGVVTTYGYDPTHAGVTSVVTQNPGGTNPSTQIRYTQISGIWMPTSTWSCRTQANCENAADAVKTTTQYNTNLLPIAVTAGAGDGALQATTAVTYTAAGDILTVDGPLPGSTDTTRYYYDAARQSLGAIGPDPDGSGPLSRRAVRTAYDNWGRATSVSQGSASDQGDSALANMTPLQTRTASLDDAGRTRSVILSAGGAILSRIDYAYDAAGRSTCAAQRMNPATFATAVDACTVGADAGFGSDRVQLVQYSPAGSGNAVWKSVTTAYGTSAAATETVTETASGKVASVTDGNGNRTSYAYDGFDRPSTVYYPSTAVGANASSGSDYEQLGYDAKGNVTSRRLRDGQTIGYSYDALNRLVQKDLPGNELDVTYDYDLLSRPISAATSAQALSFTYDALGRNITQSGPLGTVTSAYDLAGRRTMLAWPDSFYVTYDYLVTGEMTAVRENGSASGVGVLATFGYDDLGQRISLTLGNGTSTTYTRDAASRLASLTHDLAGTSADLTLGFTYNPAGQIASVTRSNDAYVWTAGTNRDDASTANGLNQILTVGAGNLGYDARGNLTSTGANNYTYSSENLLTGTNLGVSLAYDPLNRLSRYTTPSSAVDMLYDGSAAIADIHVNDGRPYGGTVAFRYIWGPKPDELLMMYVGANTVSRRFFSADERGSLIAASNVSGVVGVYAYDEYGVPSAANSPRFGYTGQRWLSELGLSYYKARMYSTRLGRFLQTDPVGYGDGLNWYNYVGGDPVNRFDPSGLASYGGKYGDSPTPQQISREERIKICESQGGIWNGDSCEVTPTSIVYGRRYRNPLVYTFGNNISQYNNEPVERVAPQRVDCNAPGATPSPRAMQAATNRALSSVSGGGHASPLTSEFATASTLPNFKSGGWTEATTTHATTSFEHSLGNTGFVVKVYIGDSNFAGANTVTITPATRSFDHIAAWPAFQMGLAVNAGFASDYTRRAGGCPMVAGDIGW